MKQALHHYKIRLLYHNRPLFLIDTLYNVLFIVFLLPLVSRAFKLVMKLTNQSYITPKNALAFIVSLPSTLFLLLLLLAIPIFLFIKLSSLIFYCNTEGILRKPYFIRIIFYGILKTFRSIRAGNLALIFYAVPFYIFTCLPVILGVLLHTELEFTKSTQVSSLLKGIIVVSLILICILMFHGIFAVYYCMDDKLSFSEGLQKSKTLLKGRGYRTFFVFLISNIIFIFGFSAFYYLSLLLTSISVYLFTDKSLSITVFLAVYPKINLYATLLFSMITFNFNINLTASMFRTYQEESLLLSSPDTHLVEKSIYFRNKIHSYTINGLLVIITILGLYNFYITIRNDSLSLNEAFSGIQITSHRGNSYVAPENTLPALENAITSAADYAEIDVQQTKDGTLILMHDTSLMRTAGINQTIWELSDLELAALDVGSWFGVEFLDTKIPTLEEVMIYSKDKIKLNIELKIKGNETNIEEQLVALIEEYKYEYQCVVSSTNYNALVKVKTLNPDIKVGYILSAVYGRFYDKEYIDFFSIRYNFISRRVVENAHQAGKEVHAWTVNTSREMERMKSLGVDSIITDNPSLARKVLYRDATNDTFIQLINRMVENRSFYRISQILN